MVKSGRLGRVMTARALAARVFMRACWLFPIKNKAVFMSFKGKYSNCNSRAIYEQLRRQMPGCRYIWLMRDPSAVIEGAETVKYPSLKAIYHLATAVLWVDNSRKALWTVKRRGQYYVQAWHGHVPFKRTERDAEDKLTASYVAQAKNDSRCADLFVSGCKWRTWNFRSAFWWDGDILECGQPRSDIFFQDGAERRRKVAGFYGLPEEVNLVLYAPTFRDGKKMDAYLQGGDYNAVLQACHNRFGGEWKLMVRLHPNMMSCQDLVEYDQNILNGSRYNEINDLILASRILITDYSSCMFDAAQAGKIVLLYASDTERYGEERGMYYPFSSLPFPMVSSVDELSEAIKGLDVEKYEVKRRDFLEQIGNFNCASSSQKAAEYIIGRIKPLLNRLG